MDNDADVACPCPVEVPILEIYSSLSRGQSACLPFGRAYSEYIITAFDLLDFSKRRTGRRSLLTRNGGSETPVSQIDLRRLEC